jgi:uncharacterized protein (DUF1330 family)
MLKGYLVMEIEITDHEAYARYQKVAGPVMFAYGGRLVASQGKMEALEGNWNPSAFFVVEFPSYEHARALYFSGAYQRVLPLRLSASKSRGILIEGSEHSIDC